MRHWFRIRHLFDFRGRASRREHFLFLAIFYATMFIPLMLIGSIDEADVVGASGETHVGIQLFPLYCIVVLLPMAVMMWAVSVRRVHDHGKPWFLLLLSIIPLVGWIFWLIMMLTPGHRHDNAYGPDPRLSADEQDAQNLSNIFG
jgi:uncharacterized membrane protein YhaH (DUF805 family)|eukprot:TRINITY_DN4481_c0_g1_i2.p1 TRINITY_DN4481_c0_g1~~TRINITY_DN4481_c0_g1_i2.p1  ORF type:complete len:145 (+),score=18.78 TRINITY_DN4481_c0_g1_i2:76-510(+)